MPTLYDIALFIHVTGVLFLFIATSFEMASLARLRGATTSEQAREAGRLTALYMRLILPAVLTVFLAGLYMALTAWNFTTAWIDVALALFFLHAGVARILNAPRAKAIHATLAQAPSGPLASALRRRIGDPVLNASAEVMFAQTLGIVFLMTVKPELVVTLLSVAVTTLLGLIPTFARVRRAPSIDAERDMPPVADRALSASGAGSK